MKLSPPQIAYFITPHGFGHAARACACMAALEHRMPGIGWHLFTQVPEWFFRSSGIVPASYHALETDIGLLQYSPWEVDLPATLTRLAGMLPFQPHRVASLAETVKRNQCRLIICDIAALGVAVARQARLPSVLVENFTWDWIYDHYTSSHPGIEQFRTLLAEWYGSVDHHIQTAPWCLSSPTPPVLQTRPVCRTPRTSRANVRQDLNIPEEQALVLITMGGIPDRDQPPLQDWGIEPAALVIPGNHDRVSRSDNIIRLPYHSEFYHPDLIRAADLVIGKAGYSTLAEVYHAGVPFAYITRDNFRESDVLSHFIENEMTGRRISEDFWGRPDEWAVVGDLMNQPRCSPAGPNGAEEIARYIVSILGE